MMPDLISVILRAHAAWKRARLAARDRATKTREIRRLEQGSR